MKTLQDLKLTKYRYETLKKLNINTVEELLMYYPFRYEIHEYIPYASWKVNDKVIIHGRIVSRATVFRYGYKKAVTRFHFEAEQELFEIVLYNQPWITNFKEGNYLTIVGKYQGNRKIVAMNYNTKSLKENLKITPIYSTKEGIKQTTIKDIIDKTIQTVERDITNTVPSIYREKYRLIDKVDALKKIHNPTSQEDIKQSYRHLKYEEFLLFYLSMMLLKKEHLQEMDNQLLFDENKVYEMIYTLPYSLTVDQLQTIKEVLEDLKSSKTMHRLVQGDVGCGKTIVAMLAMYACVLGHGQAAMLVPTEILAKQHYESILQFFNDSKVRVEVLYSSLPSSEKKRILNALEQKEIDILVGTHSLFQEQVVFANLRLVVADEQHRFGVMQRRKMINKGSKVNFLLMSATPIPRTLASVLYGDLDVSTIRSMPSNRKGVITKLVKKNSILPIYNEILDILKLGQQVYVVCPAIDENEQFNARNVYDIFTKLSNEFKDVAQVSLLHGKMSLYEKEQVMNLFKENKVQILVSTTVIEVGINVENATCMIIYDAQRFGLSQLHQLRGRVVRGQHLGHCYLLTNSKEEQALKRLDILTKTTNGFELSLEDLKIRGPGDLLGYRQSGLPSFILGNIFEDSKIIEISKKDAVAILNHLEIKENKALVEQIKKRLKESIEMLD